MNEQFISNIFHILPNGKYKSVQCGKMNVPIDSKTDFSELYAF